MKKHSLPSRKGYGYMEHIIWNEKRGVPFITFPGFRDLGVRHGFSTKEGGVSKGDCATMNMSFTCGDDEEDVRANHRLFAAAVGYPVEDVILSSQIHETVVRRVDASDCGKGLMRESDIIGVDGLITNDPRAVLMTFFADCVPLLFYDPVKRAVGAAHSGWRGTVKRMGARTVEAMQREFGCRPQDMHAVIGPSICRDCYEVDGDVIAKFRDAFSENQWAGLWESRRDEKYQLDLWAANRIVLREAGIPDGQIETAGFCTCCHPDVLFSHRASNGRRGALSAVITLS